MKIRVPLLFFILFKCLILMPCFIANAQETLRYSCSYQILEALGTEEVSAFTKETGIQVDLYASSSSAAVYRLMNDLCDIAAAAEGLRFRYKEFGYLEIPFCKDPLAVIINKQCSIQALTEKQLQEIFGGHIKNWKEVGGPDEQIIVIVPGENTAAYKNFCHMVMKEEETIYGLMSYRSTMVIHAVKYIPWAISFIAHAAIRDTEHLRMVKINGLLPSDKDYPYHQTFYYVTKGEPVGAVKQFIDFTMSEKGQAMIKAKGMMPVIRQPHIGLPD